MKAKAKTNLPHLDPLAAATETARCAQEGAVKLARAVDILRGGLETITVAEFDHRQQRALTPADLRALAVEALNAYSALTGQSWRRHKIVNSRAGDRDLTTLEG